MKKNVVLILSIFMLLGTANVFAATELVERFTDAELIKILKDDGYSAVSIIDDGAIKVNIDGRAYVLLNKPDGDLQTYYSLTGVTISYKDINEWNRTRRLSRTYLDSDIDPVIESDLLANGGLTATHVTEFFRIFVESAASFRGFLLENDKE